MMNKIFESFLYLKYRYSLFFVIVEKHFIYKMGIALCLSVYLGFIFFFALGGFITPAALGLLYYTEEKECASQLQPTMCYITKY